MKKIIINFAPTGIKPTKKSNKFVPLSEAEIVEDVVKQYSSGIQMVHLHVKNELGENTSDKVVYARVIRAIRMQCPDIIICASLSGRNLNTFESRSDVLNLEGIEKPDMGSLTLSSMNFYDDTSTNTPEMIISLLKKMNEKGCKPELEVFDVGMVHYSKYLIKKGLLVGPYYYNVICGNLSSAQATMEEIVPIINALPPNSIVSFGGIGLTQLDMNIYGILNADGIRIGLEDNLYYDNKKTICDNSMLIDRALNLIKIYGRELYTPKEVRQLLGLTINCDETKLIKWLPFKKINLEYSNTKLLQCEKTNIFTNQGINVLELQQKLHSLLKIDNDRTIILTNNGATALTTLILMYDKLFCRKLKYAVQSFTFFCCNQFLLADTIVLDIDENMQLSMDQLIAKIDQYDGIIITNCFGNCVDIHKYEKFCTDNNKILLFDNASCPYTFYNNKNTLNYGNGSIISLHHTKQLGFGEGGAVVIDIKYKELMEKIISFGNSKDNKYCYDTHASNFKMSEISAIFIHQWLINFDTIVAHHVKLYEYFTQQLLTKKLNVKLFKTFSSCTPFAFTLAVIFDKSVDITFFEKFDIEVKKYYYPIGTDTTCTNSLTLFNNIICFPLHIDLKLNDIDKYIKSTEMLYERS